MDLYIIPFEDEFIVYRPLRRLAFVGNGALAEYVRRRVDGEEVERSEDIESFLEEIDFWRPDIDVPGLDVPETFRPAMGVLLMTNQCNLRCVYCYANAGVREVESMPWDVARPVIDAVAANAADSGQDQFSLSFHGGGEPTVCWDVVVRSVEHARAKPLPSTLSITTNGVLSDAQRTFICRQFDEVSLSMDGVATVQDRQRPRMDGSGSAESVMETVAALDEADIGYGIRMTVLPDSLESVRESVAFICEHTKARSVQIEPTYTSTRGVYADMEREFGEAFAKVVIDAYEIGRQHERFVYYSTARPWVAASLFCTAPVQALVATPTGHLVRRRK